MARARGPLKVQPLWVRVERNRLKLAVFIVAFLFAWAIAFVVVLWLPAVLLLAIVASVGASSPDPGWLVELSRWVLAHLGATAVGVGLLGAACSAAYAAVTLAQPIRKQLAALGVYPVRQELPETRRALRDMAIASGFADLQPELFVLESSSLNAFIIARAHQRAYVVITSRMAERMSVDRQRAVFANLMSRLRAGDVQWATAVSALMAPVWRWKDLSTDSTQAAELSEFMNGYLAGDSTGPTYTAVPEHRRREPSAEASAASMVAFPLVGPVLWLTYVAAVIASELVAFGHRRSHLVASQLADAEGMLLLKDPEPMLHALREAIEADNRVRVAQPLYAQLFYIWAGDDLTDEDDPEWQRLDRLQEIVGTDGFADAEGDMLRPAEEYADFLPPAAPSTGERGQNSYAPPPKEDEVVIQPWVFVWVPWLAAVVGSMIVAAPLMNMGLHRPVGAPAGSAAWQSYMHAFSSAEIFAVIAVVLIVFLASVMSGRARIGAFIGLSCAAVVLGVDVVGRGLTTTVELGMPGQLLVALVAGGTLVAGIAGGAVGSLVRRG